MNLERLEVLAKWLESGGHKTEEVPAEFNYPTWHCGTNACIAGTASVLWCNGTTNDDFVSEALGLTENQANALFFAEEYGPDGADLLGEEGETLPEEWPRRYRDVDAAWAARTIRHLMATGEVAWHLTREPAHA